MKLRSQHTAVGAGLFLVGWLLLTLASPGMAQPARNTLRDFTSATAGRQAYGLYLQNHKVGWMIYQSGLETRGTGAGKKQIGVARMAMHIELGRGQERMTTSGTQMSCYSLEGEGHLIYSEETAVENGVTGKFTARPRAGNPRRLVIISQHSGREVARREMTTRDDLRTQHRFYAWITGRPANGSKFQVHTVNLSKAVDTPSTFVFRGAKTISWGGVPTPIFNVDASMLGITSSMEIKANGWPIRARYGGAFDLRAEEEAIAKKLDGPAIDLLAASQLKTNRGLGDPRVIDTLKVELSGVGNFTIPTSARQKVVSRGSGKTTLLLQREPAAATPAPLAAAARAQYLKSTLTYPLTPAIRKLARSIVKGERDPVRKADRLQRWVYFNLRKTMAANADSADEVLKAKAGDCTEHTLLFVALARASGVPAREVGGIVYTGESGTPMFGWHAWAQIHNGRGWFSVDPTWNQVRVDATHIEFSRGEDDWAWVNILGTLGIKIVDFRAA